MAARRICWCPLCLPFRVRPTDPRTARDSLRASPLTAGPSPRQPRNGNYQPAIKFDGANGVGAVMMRRFIEHLGASLQVEMYNEAGQLNHQVRTDAAADESLVCSTVNEFFFSSLVCSFFRSFVHSLLSFIL